MVHSGACCSSHQVFQPHVAAKQCPAPRACPSAAHRATHAAAAANPQVQAPLYTKLSMPVYSLSTSGHDEAGPSTLNLVTYAAPVSIQPRRYALGLYVGTLSHQNFRQTGRGVLQVLRLPHSRLFQLLGKTSGRTTDKLRAIKDAGFELVQRFGLPTLEDAATVMELRAASEYLPCGDHDVVICEVVGHENLAANADDVLYTGDLRRLGLME